MMKKTCNNVQQTSRSDDPVWYFLAEFSLSEWIPDQDRKDELADKLLLQTMQNLGISPAFIENIKMSLTGFAKEALEHFKPGKLDVPGRIRLYCEKKMIDAADSAETSKPYNTEQTMEHARIIHHSSREMDGGWGYFFIERGENLPVGGAMNSLNLIDLYLYKEGK